MGRAGRIRSPARAPRTASEPTLGYSIWVGFIHRKWSSMAAREMVGSDRATVLAALHEAQPEEVASVTFAADRRSVTIGAGDGRSSGLLVRFGKERTTRVIGEEN